MIAVSGWAGQLRLGMCYSSGVDSSSEARSRAAETKRRRSRAAILQAATRLFEEQGWLPTTVEAIARDAGVGTATVYNHFSNKNLIAGFAFLPVVEDLLEDTRWSDDAVPPGDALHEFIEEFATRARTRAPLTIALLEAVNDSAARSGADITPEDPRYWLPIPGVLTTIISRGQMSGAFLDYPPAVEAGPLFSNLVFLRILARPKESAAETSRLVLTIVERTLGISRSAQTQPKCTA